MLPVGYSSLDMMIDMGEDTRTEQSEQPVARCYKGDNVKLTLGVSDANLATVYSDDYIRSKIAHDGRSHAPLIHPLAQYLSAWVNDKFAGAFLAIKFSNMEIEWHSLLLREYVKNSRELGAAFLKWAFTENNIERVTAYIIQGLDSVVNYGLKLGMRYEGFRRDSCKQNGKIKGVHILGITRTDWSMV